MSYEAEMRIYEHLGVKQFRMQVFKLEKLIHRKDKRRNINYHVSSFEAPAIEAFLKYLFYNGAIHVRNILFFVGLFLFRYCIFGCASVMDILLWLLFIKDWYCVMLQRYNFLRIKLRSEQLKKKRSLQIEKKASKLFGCSPYESKTELQQDLLFVQSMLRKLRERESIVIGKDETQVLCRLQKLL